MAPTTTAPAWHTPDMSLLRTILGGVAEGMAPDPTMASLRFRHGIEMVLTILAAILAVILAIGYQVFLRVPRSWLERVPGLGPPEE